MRSQFPRVVVSDARDAHPQSKGRRFVAANGFIHRPFRNGTETLAFAETLIEKRRLQFRSRVEVVEVQVESDAFEAKDSLSKRERNDPIVAAATRRLRPGIARVYERVFAQGLNRTVLVEFLSTIGIVRGWREQFK